MNDLMLVLLTIAWLSIAGGLLYLVNLIQGSDANVKKALSDHQAWLFDQLYNMAPGKVLKPNETEEESEETPAVVIHTNRDPMNEFKGKKDDWRD